MKAIVIVMTLALFVVILVDPMLNILVGGRAQTALLPCFIADEVRADLDGKGSAWDVVRGRFGRAELSANHARLGPLPISRVQVMAADVVFNPLRQIFGRTLSYGTLKIVLSLSESDLDEYAQAIQIPIDVRLDGRGIHVLSPLDSPESEITTLVVTTIDNSITVVADEGSAGSRLLFRSSLSAISPLLASLELSTRAGELRIAASLHQAETGNVRSLMCGLALRLSQASLFGLVTSVLRP